LKFKDLHLHPDLLEGLDAMQFETATPIQEQAVPLAMTGTDIIGVAQTGTGKTAAFLLPALHKILSEPKTGFVRVLVIVPTRELAVQIDQSIVGLAYFTSVTSLAVYGGGDGSEFNLEKNALKEGVDIVIATPGRLISHQNLGYVDFSQIDMLILDEADRMLDMGFFQDLMRITKHVREERQTLMFSATMPDKIGSLANKLLKNPKKINIAISKPAEGVLQVGYMVFGDQKLPLIKELLAKESLHSVLVFSSTKKNVSAINRTLLKAGLNSAEISSDLDQKQREQVLLDYRNKKLKVLVATDVLSRGIDVEGIELIINYDVPSDAEDYVHRVGRTARADKTGIAITLISPDDQDKFLKIEKLIGSTVQKQPAPSHLGASPEYNPRERRGGGGKKKQYGRRKKR
jgi:ATP-dependent RNA helicase RhlE